MRYPRVQRVYRSGYIYILLTVITCGGTIMTIDTDNGITWNSTLVISCS